MKKNYLLLALIAISTSSHGAGKYLHSIFTPEQATLDRIDYISKLLLNHPYEEFISGEGEHGDLVTKPIWTLNKFDCLTYVDTVLALSFSKSESEFETNIGNIRYKNRPYVFLNRNHFTNIDWNYNNQKKLYISDITKSLASNKVKTQYTTINKPRWYQALATHSELWQKYSGKKLNPDSTKKLKSLSQETQSIKSIISYIPISEIINTDGKILEKLPKISIVEFVRNNWDTKILGTDLDISHIGFLIKKDNKIILRHASQEKKITIDADFISYLKKHYSKSLVGINIQKINLH